LNSLFDGPQFWYVFSMIIVLASGNPHKKEEFSRILADHTILVPGDLGLTFDHEETGTTFLENALGKALALHRALPGTEAGAVISDDSGISVPALGGEPGIYSARYGQKEFGKPLSSEERNAFLLSRMDGVADRRAFFVCAMVLLIDEYRFFTAQEILPGTVAFEPAGRGGFGYDPLLYLPERGKTVAELDATEKDLLSHRGKAAVALRTVLENHIERKRT